MVKSFIAIIVATFCAANVFLKIGGDEISSTEVENVLKKWKYLEEEIVQLSANLSHIAQKETWNIYRRLDHIQDLLDEAKKTFMQETQILSSLSKSSWNCALKFQAEAKNLNTPDQNWKACLHSIADNLARKEKLMPDFIRDLRKAVLPCYFGIQCGDYNTTGCEKVAIGRDAKLFQQHFGIGCRSYKWKETYGCCETLEALQAMDRISLRIRDVQHWIKTIPNLAENIILCTKDILNHINIANLNTKAMKTCYVSTE